MAIRFLAAIWLVLFAPVVLIWAAMVTLDTLAQWLQINPAQAQ